MRYVMLTFQGDDHLAAWEAATPEERRLEIERTIAWFREHGAAGRIVGGEELGEPRQARTVRRGGLVTDGPFAETQGAPRRVHRARGAGSRGRDRGRVRLAGARLGGRRRRAATRRRLRGRRGDLRAADGPVRVLLLPRMRTTFSRRRNRARRPYPGQRSRKIASSRGSRASPGAAFG